jgi:hypothetical protein
MLREGAFGKVVETLDVMTGLMYSQKDHKRSRVRYKIL